VLFASALAVVLPQLAVNRAEGHGWRVADNTWRNIERGLRGEAPDDDSELRRLTLTEMRRQYFTGSAKGRETRARARTLSYLRDQPPGLVIGRQLRKFGRYLLASRSIFERSLEEGRWGGREAAWISRLSAPARWMFYAIVGSGLLGMILVGWRSAGWGLLSLFAVYYLAALLALSFNVRFWMQVIPTLCLFGVGGIAALTSTSCGGRAGTSRRR
jgi:hypothetical protein